MCVKCQFADSLLSIRSIFAFLFFALLLVGCGEKQEFASIGIEDFEEFRRSDFAISESRVRQELDRMLRADTDRDAAGKHARSYYLENNPFLWITRNGISSKADSLLRYVQTVGDFGFDRNKFLYEEMLSDLKRVRSLSFGDGETSASRTLARLEYRLTRAYLRFCVGQRFGYVNPSDIFNRLDVRDSDSLSVKYHHLFDIPMKKPGKSFYAKAFEQIRKDSVGQFMRASIPDNPVYNALLQGFQRATSHEERKRYLCNMERARWQVTDAPWRHRKYVLINLPSLHLDAVDGDSVITMRIGIGALATKTPLLSSHIKRIDFNPQWVIPKSIVKKSIAPYAGSVDYFNRHNYFVMNRKTGKQVPPESVTAAMLTGSDYSVVQRGGKGNPLGSVIFRFDNNFSVFIHYTSNPDVFRRDDRSVSHGCIRAEKPRDLALFLLADKSEELVEKIDYTMNLHSKTEDQEQAETVDKSLVLGSLKVNPAIPLFITYFTLYPDRNHQMRSYRDIYGFDEPIYQQLQPYL